ncbi:hypothetical protein JCM11641_004519 [Rhodosporidiobolus odoratus]
MLRNHLRSLLFALLMAASVSNTIANASEVQVQTGGTDAQGRPTFMLETDPSEGFTMMIATYKRDQNLQPLLKHLTTTPPPSLRHIVLIWQNIGTPLPDFLDATALETYSTSGVVVTVRQSKRNSMNERFRPVLDWEEELYTKAVMIMDDDVVLQKESLEWGYQEFVQANAGGKGRIVGFTGRDFEAGVKEGEWTYVVKPRQSYSMVLSNAAWLRKEWLEKYWEQTEEMRSLRDYVDQVVNCDDILINYLVSNLTRNPPLLLQPKTPLRTIGGDGLWTRGSVPVDDKASPKPSSSSTDAGIPSANHFEQRKHCLAHYFSHFSAFAPTERSAKTGSRHFPLIKTSSSVSQDVEDHSRWLYANEEWEKPDYSKFVKAQPDEPEGEEQYDADEFTLEEEFEKAEFEQMLEGLTDEEIDELMKSLKELLAEEEAGAPSDGEEGLEEMPEELSVFEEGAEGDEQLVFGHAPGEL